MLSDQLTQLLTAFVDGELSQRQRKAVMRLLHKSSEARALLRQLQENAHKLKELPRRKLEPSLVEEVMAAIAEQKAQPKQPAQPRLVRRRWLPYVTAAMAASLLIGVVSIFAWRAFNQADGPNEDPTPIAKNGGDKKLEPKPDPIPQPAPQKPRPVNPLIAQMVEGTFENFAKAPLADKAFTAQFADLRPDKAKLGDLKREFNREPAVHLDITVDNNKKAMDRLKDVFKERGITLLDQAATKPLADKNQAKVEYLVYAENLSTDELTKLMAELSQTFVVGQKNNQRNEQSPYKNVTVTPMDKQKVAKMLGVDAGTMETKDRKEAKPEAKRLAVVLPAGTQSAEVRQFVNQRRPPQPGAVQVLIKIHQD